MTHILCINSPYVLSKDDFLFIYTCHSFLFFFHQLFDFDIEVKPILEVLVGKTVEQALLEVMEEEELANLRAQQRRFEELRNAELVETQRLEEQERRHREEKQRRMRQQLDVLKKEKETSDKIAARAFAQVRHLNYCLLKYCYNYLKDSPEVYIPTYGLPWLSTVYGRLLYPSFAISVGFIALG